MKRIALVVLIALSGLCSIFAAPTKEWRMPEQTFVPESWNRLAEADDLVLSAEEEKELADFVEAAKRHVAGRILKDSSGNPITLEEFEKIARKRFLPVVLHRRENSLKPENGLRGVKQKGGNGELQKSRQTTSAPSVAKNPVESKNHVVMNQSVSGSAEAKPSVQADEGWKWNGWKIASVVFLVLGIMGVVAWLESRHVVFTLSYVGVMSFMFFVMSGVLYFIGCSPDFSACVPRLGKAVAIGVGGLFLLACLISIVKEILGGGSVCKENTDESSVQPDGNEIPYLDAGRNGEIRRKLQMEQHVLNFEKAKCCLYVPKDWDPDVRIREIKSDKEGTRNVLTRIAGPSEHEWVTMRYMSVSEDSIGCDGAPLPSWEAFIQVDFIVDRKIMLPHPAKAKGVRNAKRYGFEVVRQCTSQYSKFHHVDDELTDVYTGAFEIDGRMHRIISVAFARKNDCWRFEYAFPAADGVTPESLDLRAEEVEAARRIFVPIETFP